MSSSTSQNSLSKKGKDQSGVARVHFSVKCNTEYGEYAAIVGDTPEFAHWNVKRALVLKTNTDQYPTWTSELPLLLKKGNLTLMRTADGVQSGGVAVRRKRAGPMGSWGQQDHHPSRNRDLCVIDRISPWTDLGRPNARETQGTVQ